jgi:CHAT domain-containing protein
MRPGLLLTARNSCLIQVFSGVRSCLVATLFLAMSMAIVNSASAQLEPSLLLPGTVNSGDLGSEQTSSFHFVVEEEKTYLVEVDQGGLDLVVTINTPGDQPQIYNSPLFRDENEIFLLEIKHTGTAVITLSSEEYTAARAALTVSLVEVFAQSEKERERLEALRLMTRASIANQRGTLEGWNEALDTLKLANTHLAFPDGRRNLARNLYSLAFIEYWQMLNWDGASELAARAAVIYDKVGQPRWSANAVQLQAASIIEKANEVEKSPSGGLAQEAKVLFDEALSLFHKALAVQQQLGFEFDAAKIINNVGLTYYYMGEWDTAAVHFRQAAGLFNQAGEWEAELDPLANLAVIDFEQGRLVKAIESFHRTLDLLPEGQSLRYRADTLDNLAASQLALGQLDDALQTFSRALTLHEQLDDLKGEGRSLAGIGITYHSVGEQELALEYLATALTATRKANDGRAQVSVLNFIGNIKRQRGDFSGALEAHSEAQLLVTSPMDKAVGQLNLSQDLIAAGRPREALEILITAERTAVAGDHNKVIAGASLRTGDALLLTGEYGKSFEAYEKAAEAYRLMGLGAEQAQSIFGSAKAARKQGRIDLAIEKAETAIDSIEGLRSQLIAPELRAFFLASRQGYYAFLIDTLMEMHHNAEDSSDQYLYRAFSVSERSRARALIDLISEASITLAEGTGNGPGSRQEQLYQRMAELRYQLNKLLESPGEVNQDSTRDMTRIQQDLAAIENELNLLQIDSHRRNPAYAGLTNPQILNAGQIQGQLDSDTALLQFALGENRSYAWLVTRESITASQLPGRQVIEHSARAVYEQLRVPTFSMKDGAELSTGLARLSEQVLEPLGQIQQRRVIIVADGILQYLPFSILNGSGKNGEKSSFIENHEIVYLPSMSVMAAQRQHRRVFTKPSREIAIFADPVFSDTDSRVTTGVANRDVNAATSSPGVLTTQLSRLPATAQEASTIADLVEPSRLLLATGFDASRESVINTRLADFHIIHFATHGLIDSRYPALSALVFSQFDDSGRPLDGFLRLHDIYNLKLNADLVVLSACSTALGREISGEGLTGLTQGLMYSGSRSVLASLWQVPDRATAELMKRFYQNLLDKKQNPASALRHAQLELAAQPRWHSPYFWSAFVLQGEWL